MTQHLQDVLKPIVDSMALHHAYRAVIKPDICEFDNQYGTKLVEVNFSIAQHAVLLDMLQATDDWVLLPNGARVRALDLAVIVHRVNHALKLDDLVSVGSLSQLSADFLSATLAIGRNILVVGPWLASVQLITALVHEGHRPVLFDPSPTANPPDHWARAKHLLDVHAYGADRIAIWSLLPQALVPVLHTLSGVAAWLDAHYLERALMRFEIASAVPGPLSVLSAIDVVVVLVHHPSQIVVQQIADIVLLDTGYRPNVLFSRGIAPIPDVLTAVASPSYRQAFVQAGFGVLADELKLHEPQTIAVSMPLRVETTEIIAPTDNTQPASQPGWELDRLDVPVHTPSYHPDAEEASITAKYGLAPPPKPSKHFVDLLQEVQRESTPNKKDKSDA